MQKVEGVKFNPKTRFTRKGNPYQKTNAAKLAGAGVGAAIELAKVVKNKDNLNKACDFVGKFLCEDAEKATLSEYKDIANEIGNFMKNNGKAIAAGLVATTALIGLCLGGIVDFAVNKIKAHKANKAAKNK